MCSQHFTTEATATLLSMSGGKPDIVYAWH